MTDPAPRTLACPACGTLGKIPKNRTRPNGWSYVLDFTGPVLWICKACDRAAHARRVAEAEAAALRKQQADLAALRSAEARAAGVPCARCDAFFHAGATPPPGWRKRAATGWLCPSHPVILPPVGFQSFRPEVIADSSGTWAGNALRFETEEEAHGNVLDLSFRWMLVREIRVVPSTDPVNYRWTGEGLEALPGTSHAAPKE